MPFSDQFNNAPPASVTPGRGAAFNNTVPDQSYATAQAFESSAYASWSPTNATPQTVNGIILPSPAQFDFVDELAPGMPFGTGTIYSVVINSGTVYPLLIATSGSYSIYATNAGVQYFYDPITGNQRVEITGSVKITNPNGYEAIGAFRHSIPSQGSLSGALTAPWFMLNFEIYLSSSRLTAQPSNTGATGKGLRADVGTAFNNLDPGFKYTSLCVFRPYANYISANPQGSYITQEMGVTWNALATHNGEDQAGNEATRTGIFTAFPLNTGKGYTFTIDGSQSFPILILTLNGAPVYLESAGVRTITAFPFSSSSTRMFSGACSFHHPTLGILKGWATVEHITLTNTPYANRGGKITVYINETGLAAGFNNTAPATA